MNFAVTSATVAAFLAIVYLHLKHESEARWRARCEQASFSNEKLTGLALRQCIWISRNP